MDIRLPDGSILRNVPEGTTKIDIAQKMRAAGREVPDSWFAAPAVQPQVASTESGQTPAVDNENSTIKDVGLLAGRSAARLGEGIVELPKLVAANAEENPNPEDVSDKFSELGGGIARTVKGAFHLNPKEVVAGAGEIGGGAMGAATAMKDKVRGALPDFMTSGPTAAKGLTALDQSGAFQATQGWLKQKENDAVAALSPDVQQSLRENIVERNDKGDLQIGEGAKDPWWWTSNIIDMAAQMAPGVGVTGWAARAGYAAKYSEALATAAARKVPQSVALRYAQQQAEQAAKRAAVIAGGLTEGGTAAGQDSQQTEDAINELDEHTMMNYAPYRQLRDQGLTHEQARAKVASTKAMSVALSSAVVVGMTGAPLNSWIAKWATGGLKGTSRLHNAAEGMLLEGGQEFVQEGAEQAIQNKAEQPITGKSTWDHVLENAITGGALGTVVGGGGGLAGNANAPAVDEKTTAVKERFAEYTAAKQALAKVEADASNPAVKISYDDLVEARKAKDTAAAALGQSLLNHGSLDAKTQQIVASALQAAKDAGIELPGETIKAPLNEQREPEAKEPAKVLNADEKSRLTQLDSIANAESVDEDTVNQLASEGLVKISGEGMPVLLPAGRRQRKAFTDRISAAEEVVAKEQQSVVKKPLAGQTQPAANKTTGVTQPVLKQPKSTSAKKTLSVVRGETPTEAQLDASEARVRAAAVGGKDLGIMAEALERAGVKTATIAGQKVKVNTEPTEAQQESGNYQKGHIEIQGIPIAIENTKGSTRKGKGGVLQAHYGYVKGAIGADNEGVDVFVGPKPDAPDVYVIDQVNEAGDFDEHKTMLGFTSRDTAIKAYQKSYDKPKRLGAITQMSVDEYKAWLKSGNKKKPLNPLATARLKQAMNGMEPVAASIVDAESDPAANKARLKELRAKIAPFAAKGDLTGAEAKQFKSIMKQIDELTHKTATPATVEKLAPAGERMSTLSDETVVTAHNDMLRSKPAFMAIREAAHGVSFNSDTAVDNIMQGGNPEISPEEFYSAFDATRAALRKQYGDTIHLYRAVGQQKAKYTTNWATTKEFAAQFGGNVISKDIPIEQVLAVNASRNGKYHELIVGEPPAQTAAAIKSSGASYEAISQYLTDDEKAGLRIDGMLKVTRLFNELPSDKNMAAAAIAGQAKRGWYQRSAKAIETVFGPDAPRFAALLAALSPQTSVQMNFQNAVNVWAEWVKAGRPQTRSAIISAMGNAVVGNNLKDSILPAWKNNAVRALTAADAESVVLSGPKVDSFAANLRGETNRVTLDSWMANFAAVDQTLFKGEMTKSGRAGLRPGYLAYTARVRQAAQYLTKLTGETWTPSEVQETVWSWAKAIYEKADTYNGLSSAAEVLQDNELTDELINATPDFASLFSDPQLTGRLADSGYREQLARLAAARNAVAPREASAPATGSRKELAAAAKRLDLVRTRREQEANAAAASTRLTGLPAVTHIPGVGDVAVGPFEPARQAAAEYKAETGFGLPDVTNYVRVDPKAGAEVAQAFEDMEHAPLDPKVEAAYAALARETAAQFQKIKATGLNIEFIKPGMTDPYAASPRMAIEDVKNNNHLWVFPTEGGFGEAGAEADYNRDNPMLAPTDEVVDGRKLVVNDVFRIVHDYFGHIKEGNGFRADGEENAWRIHSAMYSEPARAAMTTETRGQNSWLNWGPHGEKNRDAKTVDTVFAPQKIGLLPEKFWPKVAGRTIKLKRFSKATGPSAVFGAGLYGREIRGLEQKRGGERVTSFYPSDLAQEDVEEGLKSLTQYNVEVPAEQIYDANEDPLNLADQSRVAVGFTQTKDGKLTPSTDRFDFNTYERKIREAGFKGYYMPKAQGILRGQARIFGEIKATRQGETAARATSEEYTPVVTGMPVEQAQAVADRLAKALNVPVNVAETQLDLPAEAASYALAGINVKGIFMSDPTNDNGGEAYLVADANESTEEAEQTVLHEVVGHMGLRAMLGDTYPAVMDDIARSFPQEHAKLATTYRRDVSKPKQRRFVAEEVVAHAAGKLLQMKGANSELSIWAKIIAKVRDALRKIGFLKNYSRADLDALIYRARDFVRQMQKRKIWKQWDYEGDVAAAVTNRPKATQPFEVVNTKTGESVAYASTMQRARRIADKKDLEYGAIAHRTQPRRDRLPGSPELDVMAAVKDPHLDSFLSKIGSRKTPLRQRWQEFKSTIKDKINMGLFDHFHGIKRASTLAGVSMGDSGYMNARLSGNSAELVQAMMDYGHPVWKDGAPDIAGEQGIMAILRPLGPKLNEWLAYMVARRAERLQGEGRENLFTSDEIKAAKKLGAENPEFEVVAKKYGEFQSKVLDFAQEAGIIDPDSRALWENQDYIPFYRLVENGEVQQKAGGGSGLGYVRNQIVKLKGGRSNLGDPLDNILRNWLALTDASLKAWGARAVVDGFDGTGLVTKVNTAGIPVTQQVVPAHNISAFVAANPTLVQSLKAIGVDVRKLTPQQLRGLQTQLAVPAPTEDGTITVWRNGKRERWMVHDSMLFQSLQGISSKSWGPLMEIFRAPKRLVTATVTITPDFALKNVWRDMWHTFIIGTNDGKTIIPVVDTIKGTLSSMQMDETARSMLAGGASFSHGYIRAGDTAAGAKAIRRTIKQQHKGAAGVVLDSPLKLFRFYRKMLNASENANRVAIYNRALASGKTRIEALYEARDILDFGMRGNNPVVRFLTESVPFLNARLQGLYRLGRGVHKGTALGIFMRGSILAALSLAVLAHNWDDDRYKELSKDQKSNYWHLFDVFEKGDHWQIPKPFETGVIFGTIPEAIGDAVLTNADEPDAMAQAADLMAYSFGQQLNMSPQPQVIWPMIELAINKDTYTGAPILNQGDQGVLPPDQVGPNTSPTYRMLAQALPDWAPDALHSPKQLEHLGRGYIGNVQDYVLFMTDKLVRDAKGEPEPASPTSGEIPGLKSFRKMGPSHHTKYMDAMYDIATRADLVAQSLKKATEAGTLEGDARAEELETENDALLSVRKDFDKAVKKVSNLKKQQRAIQLDDAMTGDEKRAELDDIQQEINDIAHDVYDLRPGGKLNNDVGGDLITATSPAEQQKILRGAGLPATADLAAQAAALGR